MRGLSFIRINIRTNTNFGSSRSSTRRNKSASYPTKKVVAGGLGGARVTRRVAALERGIVGELSHLVARHNATVVALKSDVAVVRIVVGGVAGVVRAPFFVGLLVVVDTHPVGVGSVAVYDVKVEGGVVSCETVDRAG